MSFRPDPSRLAEFTSRARTSPGAPDRAREIAALRLSVAVYVVVFAVKLAAYFYSGLMALLAEALHTLSDIFVSALLLIALAFSRKAPDADHPFGHGRAQYVGAVIAATLFVSFTSFELLKEALPRLVSHPAATHSVAGMRLANGVLIASMLLAAWPMVDLLREKKRGAAAKAQLVELINDQLGLLAALVGTILVGMGFTIADPIATLFVACIIAANAIGLFRENLGYLLGQSPHRDTLLSIANLAQDIEGVRGLHGLRAVLDGPDTFHAEVHIEVDAGLLIEDAHTIADRVERAVMRAHPGSQLTVHLDVHKPAVKREAAEE